MIKTCLTCSKEFNIRPTIVRRGFGKYCSQTCYIQLGKTLSLETRNRMSNARKGKPQWWNKGKSLTEEHRRKIGRKGSLHWNWKGGKETENVRVRKSIDYKLWRGTIFKKDKLACTICGASQGWDKEKKRHIDIQVDHRKSFSKYPELRLEITNGRVLCKDCHVQTRTWGNNQYV